MAILTCSPMLRATVHRSGPPLMLYTPLISATAGAEELSEVLTRVPTRIVHETWQNNNWGLFTIRADGSEMTNLTKTPDLHELYPHVSPDGQKISFVCDEGTGAGKIRNAYVMNLDGTDRKLVVTNARESCWKGDSTVIAYLKGEVEQFTFTDDATRGTFFYDPGWRPAYATLQQGTHAPVQSMLDSRRQVVRGDGPSPIA